MEEDIKKIREKLNKSIEIEEKYEAIYKISVELDELIAKYYNNIVKDSKKQQK